MIIHSPIISGSLTFADGATFTLPDNGVYSGSFSGSLQVHQVQSHLVPDTAFTYDLGSATHPFRDLYISTGSLKGMSPGGTVAFKLGSKPGGGLKVTDANDDVVEIEAKEITLKDTSGNGNNIKLKVQNGALKSTKVSNDDVEDNEAEPQTLQSNISGSLIVTGSTSLENTTITGSIDVSGSISIKPTGDGLTNRLSFDSGEFHAKSPGFYWMTDSITIGSNDENTLFAELNSTRLQLRTLLLLNPVSTKPSDLTAGTFAVSGSTPIYCDGVDWYPINLGTALP